MFFSATDFDHGIVPDEKMARNVVREKTLAVREHRSGF